MARKPADQSVNRDDIIRAAADVLRENGYDATTMKDIAARVNLTAASLYHHFRNKDFLLLTVLELGLSRAIEQIKPIVDSQLAPSDKLQRMVTVHIVDITDRPVVGAAMVFEIKSLIHVSSAENDNGDNTEFMKRRDKFFDQRDYFEELFHKVISEGIAAGEFREVDAGIVTKAMLGAQNWVGIWFKADGRLTGAEIAAIIADTFLVSLVKK